jgi:F0F1-type ATP synthase assembly protein I
VILEDPRMLLSRQQPEGGRPDASPGPSSELDTPSETPRQAQGPPEAVSGPAAAWACSEEPSDAASPAASEAGAGETDHPASRKNTHTAAAMWDEDDDDHLLAQKRAQYTAPGPKPPERGSTGVPGGQFQRGETIAFMLLAGVALGALIGWGIDKLIGTFPAFMIVGVFAGFGLALYAVFIETR